MRRVSNYAAIPVNYENVTHSKIPRAGDGGVSRPPGMSLSATSENEKRERKRDESSGKGELFNTKVDERRSRSLNKNPIERRRCQRKCFSTNSERRTSDTTDLQRGFTTIASKGAFSYWI